VCVNVCVCVCVSDEFIHTHHIIYTRCAIFMFFEKHDSQYRVAKRHSTPDLYRVLSGKEPCNQWLFCGKRPATSGMPCIFATLYHLYLI